MLKIGPGSALLSALLFGASTPFAKLLIGTVDPWMLAALLYLGSGLGLAVVRLAGARLGLTRSEAPLAPGDWPRLALVVLIGGGLSPVLLMAGLARTEASSAALLLNLEGLATLGIAWVVFRENVDRPILLGALAILAAAVLLSWPGGTDGGLDVDSGALLIAAACLGWGIDNNLTRTLSAADPLSIAMVKGLVAGSVNLGLALSVGAPLPGPAAILGAGVVGLLGYGVSVALYVLALRHLGAARAGAYFSTAPFFGAVLAILLFHEAVDGRFAVAALLMGIGVILHLIERHQHDHDHETLEHSHRHAHDDHHAHPHDADAPAGEPHTHPHRHAPLVHSHPHNPDLHHRHRHAPRDPS